MENNQSGGSGGGGNTNTPIGAVPAGNPAAPVESQVAEPSVLDVDDNALIRIKGSDKPVKFGEHVRGFQSQWTKAAQRAKALETQLAQERGQRERYEAELQRSKQGQQGGQQGDVYESLRALPYLTGNDAVTVVQQIGDQIKQRDMVLLGALKQMQQMQKIVRELHGSHTSSSFDAKIDKWLGEGGFSTDLRDLAKEVYLAYEGDDLDQEFPRIFGERVQQVRKAFDTEREGKLRAARGTPFVPGRGGQAGPSKPLELKGNLSSRQTADELWNLFNKADT